MTPTELHTLTAAGESQTLEFKSSFDKANYKSRLRNKLVAEAFYLTGNIEKYGSGFIRIRKALRDYPEVSFNAEEVSGGIGLTFIHESQPESAIPKIPTIEQTSEKSSEKILHHLKGEPTLSAQSLAEKLGISSRAVEKQIDLLKKEGRLSRVGPAKGGYWNVIQ